LLLDASGERGAELVEPVARWRVQQALRDQGLIGVRGRLERRAVVHRLWALPGELRALRDEPGLVLTGSSAAGVYELELAAPETVDAYVQEPRLADLVGEHGLEDARTGEANVVLRGVPAEAWMLDGWRAAPKAAVAVDLASYPDSRSSRVGMELLEALDHGSERVSVGG
jgi:hypothetical protein